MQVWPDPTRWKRDRHGRICLLKPCIQILPCDFLNHKSQDHIVRIRIDGLGSGFIIQWRFADHFDRGFPGLFIRSVPGKQRILRIDLAFFQFLLVEPRRTVFGISGETALVPEKIPDRQLCFPAFYGLKIRKRLRVFCFAL